MSRQTIPRPVRLYSRPDVAAHFLDLGSAHSRLLWLVILSHTSWDGSRAAWATDATLRHETGIIDDRDLRRSLTELRRAGILETPRGERPGARRKTGRVLIPKLASPVKILVPDRWAVARLWALGRMRRRRPCEMVLTAVGAYALACEAVGRHLREPTPIACSQGDLRRLIGSARGAAHRQRVRDLVDLGVLQRKERDIIVTPVDYWSPTRLVMEEFSAQPAANEDPRPEAPPPELPPWMELAPAI